MKKIFLIVYALGTFLITNAQERNAASDRVQDIIATIKDPSINKTIVIAHRADWRNAPENSLKAIQSCIDMGVDVVELDIRMTKDSTLVIMHDAQVDRTTNGKGLVKELTLDSLKSLRLLTKKNGSVTEYQVATLKEVLALCKDKIVIDFDVKGAPMDLLLAEINEFGSMNQSLFLGYTNYQETTERMGDELPNVIYAVGMHSGMKDLKSFMNSFSEGGYTPQMFAPKFKVDTDPIVGYFDQIKEMGSRIWIHTITASRSGKHHDDLAVEDPDAAYGWLLERGVTVFQTDRPQLLLDYLRDKNLHN